MLEIEHVSVAPFSDHLLPKEKVVWTGRPKQGLLLMPQDGILIPFSLLWGGFAIYWETSVLRADAPAVTAFALFGAFFVLIAVFLIFGRFFLDAWLRAHTSYALTDRRVLIARTGSWGTFKALNLNRLPEAVLTKAAGGRGSIRFGAPAPSLWFSLGPHGGSGFGSWVPTLDPTPQFLAIADAQRVFATIQERASAKQ